jgi:hypothetical protein
MTLHHAGSSDFYACICSLNQPKIQNPEYTPYICQNTQASLYNHLASNRDHSILPTCWSTAGNPFVLRSACFFSTSSWTRSIDLKYLTVLTWSSMDWKARLARQRGMSRGGIPEVASSSTTIRAQGCIWRAERVHYE